MIDLARERLLGWRHAFDDPATALICVSIGIALGAAGVAIVALASTGRLSPAMRRELLSRWGTWLAIAPAVIGPILLGAAWTILLVAALSLWCVREFSRATGLFRERTMSLIVVLGVLAVNFAALDHWYGFFVALTPLTIISMAAGALLADRPTGFIQRVGLAALAFLLFGVCLSHLSYFANERAYRPLLLLLLVSVAMNDVFAFVTGKLIGGRKLAPRTSPNKTVAGAVGAVALTTALFMVLGSRVFAGTMLASPMHLATLGALVSIAAQCGDLTVSSIKRDVGVKDMGAVLPGHGGVLDRCNSLLLAAPAMFHYVGYFQGVGLDEPVRIITG